MDHIITEQNVICQWRAPSLYVSHANAVVTPKNKSSLSFTVSNNLSSQEIACLLIIIKLTLILFYFFSSGKEDKSRCNNFRVYLVTPWLFYIVNHAFPVWHHKSSFTKARPNNSLATNMYLCQLLLELPSRIVDT